jgi:hypothetical protein
MVLGAAPGRITPTPLTLPRFESVAAFVTGAVAWVGLEETIDGRAGGAPCKVGAMAPGHLQRRQNMRLGHRQTFGLNDRLADRIAYGRRGCSTGLAAGRISRRNNLCSPIDGAISLLRYALRRWQRWRRDSPFAFDHATGFICARICTIGAWTFSTGGFVGGARAYAVSRVRLLGEARLICPKRKTMARRTSRKRISLAQPA